MSTTAELEEAKAKLTSLVEECNALRSRLAELQKETRDVLSRLHDLRGDAWGIGEVDRCKQKVAELERLRDDESKPKVIWDDGQIGPEIVHKLTPKRIHVRLPGSTECDMYRFDGTPVRSFNTRKLDVAAMGIGEAFQQRATSKSNY